MGRARYLERFENSDYRAVDPTIEQKLQALWEFMKKSPSNYGDEDFDTLATFDKWLTTLCSNEDIAENKLSLYKKWAVAMVQWVSDAKSEKSLRKKEEIFKTSAQ